MSKILIFLAIIAFASIVRADEALADQPDSEAAPTVEEPKKDATPLGDALPLDMPSILADPDSLAEKIAAEGDSMAAEIKNLKPNDDNTVVSGSSISSSSSMEMVDGVLTNQTCSGKTVINDNGNVTVETH